MTARRTSTRQDTPVRAETPPGPAEAATGRQDTGAWHTSDDLRTGVHAMLTHQGYTIEEIEVAEQTRHTPDCDFDGQHWDCTDENGRPRHPLGDEIDQLAELLDVALTAITTRPDRYDQDPAAHAWARDRIQHVIDGVTTTARTADRAGRHEHAAALYLYAAWMARDLIDGTETGPNPIPAVFADPNPRDQEPTP